MSVFPAKVHPGQLAAFLKLVYASNGVVQVQKLADDLGWDLNKLLPTINAAEMLGLVTVEKGGAELSQEGQVIMSVKKVSNEIPPDLFKAKELRNSLLQIEPFKTALTFKKFTGEQLAKELAKKGIMWHYKHEVNSLIVNDMLMHWGVRTEILDYDGSNFTTHVKGDSSSQ